jgi:predicted metal-dependent hydrolase
MPMCNYRAFLLNDDGHVVWRVDLIGCEDDAAAKLRSELLADLHDVELWDGGAKVAEFNRRRAQTTGMAMRFDEARQTIQEYSSDLRQIISKLRQHRH